ncbi:MAG: hypothetical protein F6K54_40855 [Okeania sp. SIO3B5]|uniref:hypothetical protein n=1 Tax=Okeania sp. SIO3B5 TaxID=2607811 RepID=UPI0013FED198|nr:hypothetical protein [Okeania sp. SIO3B5]NEO58832.1 hypothetical protein [Okeania sp. SIO3B5]
MQRPYKRRKKEEGRRDKYLGLAEKVLWVKLGDRRQPTPNPSQEGDRRNGNLEEVGAGVFSQDCSAQLLSKILNF